MVEVEILTSFLTVLLEKLLPLLITKLEELKRSLGEEAKKLKGTLSIVMGFLEDAERHQEDNHIKAWLDSVKEAAYEANDLLDDINVEVHRRQHIDLFPRVRTAISPVNPKRIDFHHKASTRLEKINEKLDDIVLKSQTYSLRRTSAGHGGGVDGSSRGRRQGTRNNSQTSGFLDDKVFGRENEVLAILDLMLFPINDDRSFDVISIHGMVGIGKTTVAQMVYNHWKLADVFETKKWIHVRQEPDVRTLLKSIIQSFTGGSCDLSDLDALQRGLRVLLRDKKYLIVLDDLSNESHDYWDGLKACFSVGVPGSKVLITTRSRALANVDGAFPLQLEVLPNDDCLRLFNSRAFGDASPVAYPNLDQIGRRIVERCKGLPLAVEECGRSLRCKSQQLDRSDSIPRWERMSRKDLGEILHRNSDVATSMPSDVKRCFAYCSLFPAGFRFDKETMIQLWMAQNFGHDEERCEEYFEYLLNWSVFKYLDYDYKKTRQTYVLHDAIHSVARFMADEECVARGREAATRNLSHKTRHVSLVGGGKLNLESLYAAEGLYTLLLLRHGDTSHVRVPDDLAEKLKRLRSLDLSETDLQELPDSIGDLNHLRYLALRNTKIKKLPASVRHLYNLQTLALRNCYYLAELPSDSKHLVNLLHLDLHLDDNESQPGALRCMPRGLTRLTNLRMLSRFVISSTGVGCSLSELSALHNLRGRLHLSNLDCIVAASEAEAAKLKDKMYLRSLDLQWGNSRPRNSMDEASVLQNLMPHPYLEELTIRGYSGSCFPSWMSDPSFSNLMTLKLDNCDILRHLPPLGQLPYLEQLFLKGLDGVETIDCNFCGSGGGFRSLKKLHTECLRNLKSWSSDDDNCKFSSLRELVIHDCPRLTQISHCFSVLAKIEIDRCPSLYGLRPLPSLQSLDVKASGPWVWESLRCLSSLSSLTLTALPTTAPLPVPMQNYATIKKLEFISCGTPEYLPEDWLPAKLTHLKIKHCPNLRALPIGLRYLRDLRVLKVEDCQTLEALAEGMVGLIALEYVEISCCPSLVSLPTDGLPAGVQCVSISGCRRLKHRIQSDARELSKLSGVRTVLFDGVPAAEASTTYSPYS